MPNVTSFAFGSSTLAMVFLQCTLLDLLHVPLREEAVYVKPLCFEECLRTQDGTWRVKNHDPAVNAANTKGEGGTTLRPQVASEGSTLTASKPPAGQCCYDEMAKKPLQNVASPAPPLKIALSTSWKLSSVLVAAHFLFLPKSANGHALLSSRLISLPRCLPEAEPIEMADCKRQSFAVIMCPG